MIKLLICEDEMLVRLGLVALLDMETTVTVVGEASNGREAVTKVASLAPDVVLMDIRMPIMDGLDATRIISYKHPRTRVIILTTYDNGEYVLEGIKAGAMGYVLKDTDPRELVAIVQRVHSGEQFIQPAIASRILFEISKPSRQGVVSRNYQDYELLTERELTIISRLADGMTSRDVAHELKLSEGTIRNYVSNILSKLQAGNRIEAINRARQHKLI